MNAVGEGANAALRARQPQTQIIAAPESSPNANGNASAPANSAAPPPGADPDASPASAPPKQKSQPSSPPPEPADETAKPTPAPEATPAPVPAPVPAPSLSPVVAVEEPPKDTADAKPGEGAANGSIGDGKAAAEDLEAVVADGGEGSSSEDGLVKKGEENVDGA